MDRPGAAADILRTDSLAVDPHYNFLNKMSTLESENNDQESFFSNSDDSPYSNSVFECKYVNVNEFKNLNSKQDFLVMSINMQSLNAKFGEFKELLDCLTYANSPDVICMQELWQFPPNVEYVLAGYQPLFYKLRSGSVQGGGVGIYVKTGLNCTIDISSSVFFDRIYESIAIVINCNKLKKKTKIISAYRPGSAHPSLCHEDQINQFFELLSNQLDFIDDCPTYIFGDLNLDLIKFDKCAHVNNYIDLLFSHGFIQTITLPTRCTNLSATLIDHCITNVMRSKFTSYILTTKLSDHFPFIVNLSLSKAVLKPKTISTRNYSFNNVENFKKALAAVAWDDLYLCTDAQESYNIFSNKFFELFDLFFPLSTVKFNKNIHYKEKWFTSGMTVSRGEKNRLSSVAAMCPSLDNITKYRTYRNLYNKITRAAKKIYFEEELKNNKSNLKKTWNIIRQAIKLKSKKSDVNLNTLIINNTEVQDPLLIAEHLNKFFASAPADIIKEIPPTPEPETEPDIQDVPIFNMSDNEVTAREIVDTVKLLEPKKSCDVGGVSMFFVKKCIYSIAQPLKHVFGLSFSTGIVPDQFKIAKVVPIYKSGDPRSADNYRPISLLNNFSKIIEKIMCLRLTAFLESNSLISRFQFGFRKSHSTLHPITHFQNFITQAFNNKEHAIAIFCDLRKAFDTVPHTLLLKKLSKLGIRGTNLQWFKSYLSGRRQFVHINGVSSSMLEIILGVPQGSILGPLLFLLFINDLPLCTKLLVLMFADDTTLLASGKNLTDLYQFVNEQLHHICTYFRLNRLALHPKKTQYILFSKSPEAKNTDLVLYLNNNNFNVEENINLKNSLVRVLGSEDDPAIKFLGLYIDPNNDYKYHVKTILKKLSTALYFIRTAKLFLTQKSLTFIYYSLFHSHLIYGIQIWSCCSQNLINNIFKLQKKAIRIINNAKYNSHTESLFKKCKILPLPSLIEFFKLQFMQQYVRGHLPASFNDVWITQEARRQADNVEYLLRNSENFYTPMSRLFTLDNHPYFLFPKMWENFKEENIKILRDKNQFNTKLKEFLLNKLNDNYVCNRLLCPHCHLQGDNSSESE